MSIPGLEKSLHQYTLEPSEKPFDMKSVPLATTPITEQKTGNDVCRLRFHSVCLCPAGDELLTSFLSQQRWRPSPPASCRRNWHLHAKTSTKVGARLACEKPSEHQAMIDVVRVLPPAEQLAAIPEFQGLGPLFKSSEAVQLTEAETEYVVRCVKHTFAGHMVFQFDCTNTLNDQLLQKVVATPTTDHPHYHPTVALISLSAFSGGRSDGTVRVVRGGSLRPCRQPPLQPAWFLLHPGPPARRRPHSW